MQVKTFHGPSTREVLSRIKSELGKDAVILDSQTIKQDGRKVCQITAAIEPRQREQLPAPSAPPSPDWREWQRDWADFKENVFTLLKPHMERGQLNDRQRLILDSLEREGVRKQVLVSLWQDFKEAPKTHPLTVLSRLVGTRPWDAGAWSERYHALAGPHGVGKSTTCLRLALNTKRAFPGTTVCLVNADLQQGRGRLFLQHYAELYGIEYIEADAPRDLALVSRTYASYDKVFIDLPALTPGRSLDGWLHQRGCGLLQKLCVHLVLSPLYSENQLESYLNAYQAKALASLVWTKIDEACTFGSMINASHDTGLPISLICNGPRLKDGFFPARDKLLWTLVFRHHLPGCRLDGADEWSVATSAPADTRTVRVS